MILGKHINRYYLRFAPMLLLGLVALVGVDFLQLEIPGLYQLIINGLGSGYVTIDGQSVPFDMTVLVGEICLPMVGIILLMVLGRFLWRVAFFGAAIRVETDLRDRMFDRARRLSPEFYSRSKIGDLMSLFTNDLDTVQECFGWGIMMFFDALLLGVLAVIRMAQMDLLLTGLSLIPMGLLLAAATVLGQYMTKKWDIRQAAFSKLSDFSQESFSGIGVIKAFVKEAAELMAFKKHNIDNEKANNDHTKASVLMRILVTLFMESVICIILGYGGYLVYEKQFNAGQLVEFIGYFTAIVWPVMAVSELIDMTSRGKASLERIGRLLEEKTDVTDREGLAPMPEIKGDITFQNLTFRYPGSQQAVLKNVSFTVKAGQSVGIVGRTGAGKTTLADLLLRCYNVPDGTVYVDGRDINQIPIQDLRAGCAYVPQDNFLFSDTIENNITFGAQGDVSQAATLSAVDDNIREFPKGYQTVLGERGVTVSGGQKQRISIARALLRNAPILILDDSVSAVDTKTESVILNNLRATRQGKTTLLIAHRISTVADMDTILFIEDGALIAQGSHAQLLESCPAYQKMVALQQLEEEGQANE